MAKFGFKRRRVSLICGLTLAVDIGRSGVNLDLVLHPERSKAQNISKLGPARETYTDEVSSLIAPGIEDGFM
jgi:hypothetical protein